MRKTDVDQQTQNNEKIMIGILGGTFDPVHQGHIAIAHDIQNKFHLNEVRLVPCYLPVHRNQPQANSAQRLEMLKLAVSGDSKLKIDDYELKSQHPCYTADTLKHFRAKVGAHQSLAFIMGLDAFNQFTNWKDYARILELCHLIVVNRPDNTLSNDATLQSLLKKHLSSNTQDLSTKAAGFIYFHDISPLNFSATNVRQKKASTGIESVDCYITENNLYTYPT